MARRATPPLNVRRADLWQELVRQRAVLLASANLSLAAESAAELYADPADQASTDLEHDVAMQVKARTFERLRHIEHALQLMRTRDYGQCRYCHQDIPYERLKVQPDAQFCVPCLTTVERKAAHNSAMTMTPFITTTLFRSPAAPLTHLGPALVPSCQEKGRAPVTPP